MQTNFLPCASLIIMIQQSMTCLSDAFQNNYLEKMPRGKQRGKFFFGSKIAALNFRKLFNYVKGLGNYAKNPVLV